MILMPMNTFLIRSYPSAMKCNLHVGEWKPEKRTIPSSNSALLCELAFGGIN
jgi:hypothetical protein